MLNIGDLKIDKRVMKYRAWNRENKTMDYDGGFLFDLSDFNLDHYKYLCLNIFIDKISEELDLMYFTGSHDKNGKEIFEADIVKWHEQVGRNDSVKKNDDILGMVLWNKEECGFTVLQLTKGKWRCQVGESLFEHDTEFYSYNGAEFYWRDLEVVGNIYENPDLYAKLKEDKIEEIQDNIDEIS